MKSIIIYSSKYGCTADCAQVLKSGLSGAVKLVNIDQTNPKDILLENFDIIIFGSSIYTGAISKKMRSFCSEYIEVLSGKRVGIFLCCAIPTEMNEYLSKNFPATLLKSAVTVKNFGGEARTDKLKGMDKLIMKAEWLAEKSPKSSQVQRIMIARQSNLEEKKRLALYLVQSLVDTY